MIEILKELKEQQKNALKQGDMLTLNNINKKIFEIREQQRKKAITEKQKQADAKTDAKARKFARLMR